MIHSHNTHNVKTNLGSVLLPLHKDKLVASTNAS